MASLTTTLDLYPFIAQFSSAVFTAHTHSSTTRLDSTIILLDFQCKTRFHWTCDHSLEYCQNISVLVYQYNLIRLLHSVYQADKDFFYLNMFAIQSLSMTNASKRIIINTPTQTHCTNIWYWRFKHLFVSLIQSLSQGTGGGQCSTDMLKVNCCSKRRRRPWHWRCSFQTEQRNSSPARPNRNRNDRMSRASYALQIYGVRCTRAMRVCDEYIHGCGR